MENREDIPRVSVGSVQDWEKVRSSYEAAATSKLQELLVLRNIADEKDAIVAHLEQFIGKTFSLAQPNLRINGHNFESLDESGRGILFVICIVIKLRKEIDVEIFDETLDRRIWSLADTRLQWHKRIAETRRSIPVEIETTISTLLAQHRELDVAAFALSLDNILEEPLISEGNDIRQRRIEEILHSTSALANELTQIVSRQQERGHKVQSIAVEVKSLKL